MNEFDHIARKLWFGDGNAIELVDALTDLDRMQLEHRLLSLYGARVNLFGSTADIKASLEKARTRG